MAFFSRVDRKVLLLVIVALISVVFVEFILDDVPELFDGGYLVGRIISALGLATISSFIFYLLVVHIPKENEREHLREIIAMKSRNLVGFVICTTHECARETGIEVSRYPSEDDFSRVLSRIDPRGPGPGVYRTRYTGIDTWWDYFRYWTKSVDETAAFLMNNSRFLDAEHILLIQRLQDHVWPKTISRAPPGNTDCGVFAWTLHQWSEIGRELEEYCDRMFPEND